MNRTYWIVGGLVVVLVGLSVASFFATHEQVEKEVREPPTGEARHNPFLALEEMLTEMGVPTSTRQTVPTPENLSKKMEEMDLEPTTDQMNAAIEEVPWIYVFVDRERSYSPEQVDEWESWVRDGGHLVVTAPPVSHRRSLLLEAFEIRHDAPEENKGTERRAGDPEWTESSADGDDGGDAKAATGGRPKEDETGANPDGDEDASPMGPDLPPERVFDVDAVSMPLEGWEAPETDWRAWNESGERIAFSLPADAGRVTVVSGVGILRNDHLGERQHPYYAWEAITLGAQPKMARTAIVRFSTPESWLGHAASYTWPFLVGLAIVLLLALNAGRWQFGPTLPNPPSEQRSRVEHIRATGEFLWEYHAASRLLEASRASLLARLAERRPSLSDASPFRARKIVREELDIDEDEVRIIFDDRDNLSEQEFVNRIEAMERYRRRL